MNVTIIADASFCPEENVGGYGYWIASPRGKYGGGATLAQGGQVTNSSCAEMMALCNALHISVRRGLVVNGDTVLMQTDCMAAIQAFQGTRLRLVNQEQAVVNYIRSIERSFGLTLNYKHVKGHTAVDDARSITNRLCDKSAKKYMRIARVQSKAQALKQLILNGPKP